MKKIIFLSAIIAFCIPTNLFAGDWNIEAELYMLATTINGDAGIGRVDSSAVELDFDTILETLDLAGMAHAEAIHSSGFGLALDYSFMDLSDDLSTPYGGVVGADLHQGVLQVDGIYRKRFNRHILDMLVGFRWWDNDIDVSLNSALLSRTVDLEANEDWIDAYVGLRGIIQLTENLQFSLRGDIGGMGLASDFTACLYGTFRYAFTDSWAVDVGYKAVWVDYESGSRGEPGYFAYDTITHGPLVGFVYTF